MSRRRSAARAAIKNAAFHNRIVGSGKFASEPNTAPLVIDACPVCGKSTRTDVDAIFMCRCPATGVAAP